MKNRKPFCTMSTEKSKKKKRLARFDRIKIIEYGCIALVILLFLGLALFYGTKKKTPQDDPAQDETAEASTATPVPTKDPSIRGMNVLDALCEAGFTVTYAPDHYAVVSPGGTSFVLKMTPGRNGDGIGELSLETFLCPDPEDDTLTAEMIREENRATLAALHDLLDALLPVFHRTVADSNTILKECQKVVKDGKEYTKHIGTFSVVVTSDTNAVPQTVLIRLVVD